MGSTLPEYTRAGSSLRDVIAWSACILDASGREVVAQDADTIMSTASVGKVFLLSEISARLDAGQLSPTDTVTRDQRRAVTDSGLWQHLAQDTLSISDACVLVGAVSDNWATNTLLDVVGLSDVQHRAQTLGCVHSTLHDYVRDERGPHDPPRLSSGTTRELAHVARTLNNDARVRSWLLNGVDLSLVCAPFARDPLAHAADVPLLWSKTGTDDAVRADIGVVSGADTSYSYAAIANWDPGTDERDGALELMHSLGWELRSRLT